LKPVIGVTSGWEPGALVEGWPLAYTPRHLITRLEQAGAAPIILPVVDDVRLYVQYIRMIDGIVIAGEVLSIHRNVLAETSGNVLKNSNPLRYNNEEAAIRYALQDDIPLLSVCRGHQVLNVTAGGDMKSYDITAGNEVVHQQGGQRPPHEGAHEISIRRGTKLHQIVGADRIKVNSFHRQAVGTVPEGFVACAFAADGHIEAIEAEDKDKFVMGLQFHPEMMEGPQWNVLFEQFVEAAVRIKATRTNRGTAKPL
jgi:putative glutamine amidotransferase